MVITGLNGEPNSSESAPNQDCENRLSHSQTSFYQSQYPAYQTLNNPNGATASSSSRPEFFSWINNTNEEPIAPML